MVAIIVLIVAIIAAVAVFDVERVTTYTHEPLFTLPWGTAPGEAGLADGADGEFYGPRSFYAGAGRITLADTFNARIQAFDYSGSVLAVYDLKDMALSSGAAAGGAPLDGAAGHGGQHPLAAFANPLEGVLNLGPQEPAGDGGSPAGTGTYSLGAGHPWINDLVVDARGHIFAADSAGLRIIQLNEGGQYVALVELPPLPDGGVSGAPSPAGSAGTDETVWVLDQLEISRQGALFLAHTYLSDEIYGRRLISLQSGEARFETLASATMGEGRELTFETGLPLPLPANSFVLAPRGRLTVEARGADPFSRIIRTYREGGIQADDWLIRHDRPIVNARLLGADRTGTAWIAINGGRSDGILTEVTRGWAEGGDMVSFQPGWHEGFHANVFARRDEEGNIFAAVPGPRGWRLDMWKASTRRRVKLASRP